MKRDGVASRPPHNLDAEKSLIGSILLEPDSLDDVASLVGLATDDFYRADHAKLWRGVLDLRERGSPIDGVFLSDHLVSSGEWDDAEGLADLIAECTGSIPHGLFATELAWLIREKARKRAVIQACTETLREAYLSDLTADDVAGGMVRRADGVLATGCRQSALDGPKLAKSFLNRQDRRRLGPTGVVFGWSDFDAITGGFQRQNLILLAARPSMGKSAVAVNMAASVASGADPKPVLFASLEMAEGELVDRIVSLTSGVMGRRLESPDRLTADESAKVDRTLAWLGKAPIHIDDAANQSVSRIAATATRISRKAGGLGLIVVDYAQLLQPEGESNDSRTEKVAEISRRLKQLAKSLNVPVVACCQLNRAAENREDRHPRLADLRESGQLEQDADLVLMLYREAYYKPEAPNDRIEVLIAKNRNGPTGSALLAYDGPTSKVGDWVAPGVVHAGHPGGAANAERPIF